MGTFATIFSQIARVEEPVALVFAVLALCGALAFCGAMGIALGARENLNEGGASFLAQNTDPGANDGRNDTARRDVERVVRGGSWRDRPHQSTVSYRRPYQPYHRVFNVGFRVVARANTTEEQNGDD
ncbi:MAG: hypothetical protein ACLFV4_02190 [Candidatus Hydrogenedentota bacterium]